MKAGWNLVAPDWSEIDTVWKNPLPFILWPICGKPLLAHWLDQALRNEATSITIYATDRPHLVRAWINRGDYWSNKIQVRIGSPVDGDDTTHIMDSFPGSLPSEPLLDGHALIEHWFAIHVHEIKHRQLSRLQIDREISPGVWAGPGAVIDPSAQLIPPVWIGRRARVGPHCRIGPNAFVSTRAVLDEDVEVINAIICEDTYIGRHTRLDRSVAKGGLLLNWKLKATANILDHFVMSDLACSKKKAGIAERLLAFLLWMPCVQAARFMNRGLTPVFREVTNGRGRMQRLKIWPRGPILIRRAEWLRGVAVGRLRMIGILPRTDSDWDALPADTRALLENVPSGVLALSDLYGRHDPSDPVEWIHAAYQAGSPDGVGQRQAIKSAVTIAMRTPIE